VVDLTDDSPPPPVQPKKRHAKAKSKATPGPPKSFTSDEEFARSLLLSFQRKDTAQMKSDEQMARELSNQLQHQSSSSSSSSSFDPTKAMIGGRVTKQ
jgi:hypothetical protein